MIGSHLEADLQNDDKYLDMPSDVIVRKISETFMQVDADEGTVKTLSDHYSFFADNYLWNPKYKSGFWDGKIRLLNRQFNTMYSGLRWNLEAYLREQEIDYELEGFDDPVDLKAISDDFDRFLKTITLPDGFDVRDYQNEAVLLSVQRGRGLIISPTGSGKSLIIYLMIRYMMSRKLARKVMLLVPTINLVTQMYSDFEEYSANDDGWDASEACHKITGGVPKQVDKPVFISTWQSVYDIKDKAYFQQFDTLFVDEVHTAEAKSITSIVERSTKAKSRFGLTGTLKDTRTNPLQLVGMFGEIHTTTTVREMIDAGIAPEIRVIAYVLRYSDEEKQRFWTKMSAVKDKTKRYTKEMDFIYEHKKRTFLMGKFVEKFPKHNTLFLFRKISHLEETRKAFEAKGFDVHVMNGSTDIDERERIRKYTEVNSGVVILATYQVFQLGINIKNLHNAVFTAPSKGRIRVLQSFGRLLRKSTDGLDGYLIDIIDDLRYKDRVNYCFQHGIQRLEYFKEEGIDIIYKKVNI